MPHKTATAPETAAIVWKGNDDLRGLLKSIADYDEDPRNIRIHPDENIAAIKSSYSEFGQVKPIVGWRAAPDSRPIILAGNGTLRSLKELGWTHIAVSEYQGPEVKARAFAAADNQIPVLAEWSDKAAEELTWINQALVEEQIEWKLEDIGFVMGTPEPAADATPRPNTKKADGKDTRQREAERTEDEDDVDAETVTAAMQIKAGDVFQLGAHRLICGDSTDPATLAALMVGELAAFIHSDPPYGLNKSGVVNDDLHGSRLDAFQVAWWKACRQHVVHNGSAFVWGTAPDLWRWWYLEMAPEARIDPALAGEPRETYSMRNEIVWDKGEGPGMCSDEMRSWASTTERAIFFMFGEQELNINADRFWPGWEPLRAALAGELERAGWTNKDVHAITGTHMHKHWFTRSQWTMITEPHYSKLQAAGAEKGVFQFDYAAIREIFERAKAEHDREVKDAFYAGRPFFDNTHDTMGEVWSFPRVSGEERHGHATPKPVAMIARAIKSGCPSGGIVLEPFIGSGSTLIAAEESGRRCFGIEIRPEYVATTIARWEKRTGLKAEKL